jgi:hypothetical protein
MGIIKRGSTSLVPLETVDEVLRTALFVSTKAYEVLA